MNIRRSTDADRAAIGSVHVGAVGGDQGREIAELVEGLLEDETAMPLLSLVAEVDGQIVGHIVFTAVQLPPGNPSVSARILAPLAVSGPHRGGGIGGALIGEGLKRLAASGVGLVFVLGHPGYYAKFGFRPAGALGLEAPYPIPPAHADAWMVRELRPGLIGSVQGRIRCARTLDQPQHWRE
jgi:putative acetyltransferase